MRRLIVPTILFFFSFTLAAQKLPESFFFEHISVPGTIQSAITEDIFQDPYGMLWIGKDALYRYNGRDFQRYDVIYPDSGLFSTREITGMAWDHTRDRLIIGTRNYGIVQYDYKSDKLRQLPSRDGVPIISDVKIANDQIWATSFTSGFFKVVNDTLVRVHNLNDYHNPTKMTTSGKDVWFGCVNDVMVVRNNVVRKHASLSKHNEYLPNSIRSSALMIDNKGRLWVGTERDGILVMDTTTLEAVKKFSPQEDPFYNSITSIVQDRDNMVWIGTRGGGLVVYSPETDTYRKLTKTSTDEGSISTENIASACVDATGIVWIGGTADLNKYDKSKIKFQHFYHDAKNPNSLSDDNIRNVYQDEEGIIYVATSGGYLNSIDRRNNAIKSYRLTAAYAKGLLTPLAICSFSNDVLLVGSSEGLLQFNKNTKQFTRFQPLYETIGNRSVRQIIKHGKEFLFQVQGRIVSYNTETNNIEIYYREQKIDNAGAVTFDNQDRMWVGTADGIVYTDKQRKKFELLKLEHDRDRPDSSMFLSLSLQPIGNEMWVNSFNNSIYVIDLTLDPPRVVEKIGTADGLPDNTVYASIPDDDGNVWISHNRGLSRYEKQTHQFIHFTVAEGLQDEEFNRLAFFKSPSGEIMLGGINGLNVFNPASIKFPDLNLRVQLVSVTSHQVKKPSMGGTNHSLIQGNEQLQLPFDNNTLQFGFFIPDYHDPIRYKIRYKLAVRWLVGRNR